MNAGRREKQLIYRPTFYLTDELLKIFLLGGFLVLLVIYFSYRSDLFASTPNVRNIVTAASVIGIVSLGQLVTVISGGFDLSVSGIVPLGSVVYALTINADYPIAVALGATVLMGVACGLVNGTIIAVAKINPLVTTLATMSLAGGLALALADGIAIPFERPADVLTRESAMSVSNAIWIFVALSLIIHAVLRKTIYGRNVYAVGGNVEAARISGIRIGGVLILVYCLSGGLSAIAGAIAASQLLTGSGTIGTQVALQSIAAVILGGAALGGGVGGVPGTILGVIILGTLSNGMQILSVQSFYQTMATGVVLIIAVGMSQLRLRPRRVSSPRK